jgi:hypothetical protein
MFTLRFKDVIMIVAIGKPINNLKIMKEIDAVVVGRLTWGG